MYAKGYVIKEPIYSLAIFFITAIGLVGIVFLVIGIIDYNKQKNKF